MRIPQFGQYLFIAWELSVGCLLLYEKVGNARKTKNKGNPVKKKRKIPITDIHSEI